MKSKYLILLLFIVNIAFMLGFSYHMDGFDYFIPLLLYLKITLGISLIGVLLLAIFKKWRKVGAKILVGVLSICFILYLYECVLFYQGSKLEEKVKTYETLSCEELEKRFEIDLENDEIMYFSYGLGYNEELHRELDEKYDIIFLHMGDIISTHLPCYNDKVNEYLKRKYDDDLLDDKWSNKKSK